MFFLGKEIGLAVSGQVHSVLLALPLVSFLSSREGENSFPLVLLHFWVHRSFFYVILAVKTMILLSCVVCEWNKKPASVMFALR